MATRAILRGKAVHGAARDTAHEGFLGHRHARWAKVAAAISLIAILAYALHDPLPRPNGGTWLGYGLGSVALLLIIWLSLIGLRKRIVTPRPYSLKAWTSAHVWLGLSLIVIGTLHTGFQLGWNVHTLAWTLMMIVILSGLWGVSAYTALPQQMSANRGEMTQPQMLEAIRAIDRQLDSAAQPLGREDAGIVRLSLEQCDIAGSLWQRLTARQPACGNRRALDSIAARVHAQKQYGRPDARLQQIQFLLERKDAALSQARRHIRMKTLLELWLYIHVPMTFALIAALAAHVLSVFLYW
ncbi:hypothetical protein [Sandarakinorhabdus sp.]|uniref:hypothetical protein n=1 Tax=Sandarakinorhabdus sp. TaxID=1916663 RepID=UPI00286DD6B0|nr:hypothetical protein [Sandarakinorhabdus sp.]